MLTRGHFAPKLIAMRFFLPFFTIFLTSCIATERSFPDVMRTGDGKFTRPTYVGSSDVYDYYRTGLFEFYKVSTMKERFYPKKRNYIPIWNYFRRDNVGLYGGRIILTPQSKMDQFIRYRSIIEAQAHRMEGTKEEKVTYLINSANSWYVNNLGQNRLELSPYDTSVLTGYHALEGNFRNRDEDLTLYGDPRFCRTIPGYGDIRKLYYKPDVSYCNTTYSGEKRTKSEKHTKM